MTKTKLISDEQSLNGATTRYGYSIPVYDDGFGDLYISRDSMGINGIVRAQTWEDAYGICEDEFFPEASETMEEIVAEYGFDVKHVRATDKEGKFTGWIKIETPNPEGWMENPCFQEGFGFRPNGPNSKDTLNHGIYAKDLNGDALDLLTPKLIAELEITLDIKTND